MFSWLSCILTSISRLSTFSPSLEKPRTIKKKNPEYSTENYFKIKKPLNYDQEKKDERFFFEKKSEREVFIMKQIPCGIMVWLMQAAPTVQTVLVKSARGGRSSVWPTPPTQGQKQLVLSRLSLYDHSMLLNLSLLFWLLTTDGPTVSVTWRRPPPPLPFHCTAQDRHTCTNSMWSTITPLVLWTCNKHRLNKHDFPAGT